MFIIEVKNKGIKSLPELSGKEDINKELLFYYRSFPLLLNRGMFFSTKAKKTTPTSQYLTFHILTSPHPHILTSSSATVQFLPPERPEC